MYIAGFDERAALSVTLYYRVNITVYNAVLQTRNIADRSSSVTSVLRALVPVFKVHFQFFNHALFSRSSPRLFI